MITTHELQQMSDVDFHKSIRDAYEIVEKLDRYSTENRYRGQLSGITLKAEWYFGRADIQLAARDRVKKWIRKQVLLRYNCK